MSGGQSLVASPWDIPTLIEQFSFDCHSNQVQSNHCSQSHIINQSKLEVITCGNTSASDLQLVLGLLLIGWKSGASNFSQSCCVFDATWNQLRFGTQMNTYVNKRFRISRSIAISIVAITVAVLVIHLWNECIKKYKDSYGSTVIFLS